MKIEYISVNAPSRIVRNWTWMLSEFIRPKEIEVLDNFKYYRRKQIAHLRPYIEDEELANVSISDEDKKAGSPMIGDMIARNPKNHKDQWLVAEQYFMDNFEPER